MLLGFLRFLGVVFFLFGYVPGLLRATSGLLISSTKRERRHIRYSKATLRTSHARFVRRFCGCAMDSGTSPTTLILSLAYLAAMIGTCRVQDPGGSLGCKFFKYKMREGVICWLLPLPLHLRTIFDRFTPTSWAPDHGHSWRLFLSGGFSL